MNQRLEEAAAHSCERADGSPDAREIDHLRHLHKTTVQRTHLVRLRTMQGHLARGKRTCAQLIFEAVYSISLAGAIFHRFTHEKKSKAPRAGCAAPRPTQPQHHVARAAGTHPFAPTALPSRRQP